MLYEIKMRTITRAQRAIYILKKNGISAQIGRLKNPKKEDGCGYTVRLDTKDIASVLQLLENNGADYYGVDTP